MLPGFRRMQCAPASIAFSASVWLKWMSAMIGIGDCTTIVLSASMSSSRGTATRTMSAPASATLWICSIVAARLAVSVFVIVCTTTGAPPPIGTPPTMICRVEAMSSHSTVAPGASINTVVNKLHHVFGYASLAAEHKRCPVARLRGWRRTWGVAMDNTVDLPGYKSYRLRSDGSRPAVFVAFVDIEPDAAGVVTGVCMPVDRDDLPALDDRERNYDRIDVTAAIDEPTGPRLGLPRLGRRPRAPARRPSQRGCAVVSRDYLDGVLAAIARIAPDDLAVLHRSVEESGLEILDLDRVPVPPSRRVRRAAPR